MDKKFGFYIFGGTLIGAFFGMLWGTSGSLIANIAISALIGTFIGWFAAAYAMEREKQKKEGK
jgi:uncharacterized membrane protein